MEQDAVLARLEPSAFRIWMAVLAAATLTALLGSFAITATSGGQRLALGICTLLAGAATYLLWQRGRGALVLTPDGLFDETGTEIVGMAEIAEVDRGAFAFKPSNGFGVKLIGQRRFAWRPGLWWAYGSRIGIGGLTSAAAGKAMADQLAIALSERADTGPG